MSISMLLAVRIWNDKGRAGCGELKAHRISRSCYQQYYPMGEDYQTAIIKLDLVRLRFTRWGQSAGIVHGSQNVDEGISVAQLRSKLAAPDKEFPTIMQTLGQI